MSVAEKVPVACPQCGKQLNVPVSAAGKQGRCPACAHVFVLPAVLASAAEDDLPQLATLASDPFGGSTPTSGYTLPPAPQGYSQQPAAYGALPAQQPLQQPYGAAPPVYPYGAGASSSAADAQAGQKYNHAFGLEQRGWDAGMAGGLAMMAIGGVWFVGGLFFGIIFYYAPILFIIGLVGFVRGLFTGNVAGPSE